ncbi:MAG: type II secretion system protein GspG [Acidobacteria bacterium]|nr:type II secretion system protein GspG [Acidobacteriota bacterium]
MIKKKTFFLVNIFWLSVVILALASPESLSPKEARRVIANIPGFEFDPDLVRIQSIDPPKNVGRGGAVVEAQFTAAFRVEKKQSWQVAEIRLGNGQWEDVELITSAVKNEKIKRTKERLDKLSVALEKYHKEKGYYPQARDIVALTDLLVPDYINPSIRTDLWSSYFLYSSDGKTYKLESLGPDKKANSGDEIVQTNT